MTSPAFRLAVAAVGVHTPPAHDMFFVALPEMVTPTCLAGNEFRRFRNGRWAGPARCCSAVSANPRSRAGPG